MDGSDQNWKDIEGKRQELISIWEDFSWYSRKYKTGMFGLGTGIDTPPLHSAEYDFPNQIIETGMKMFQTIITEIIQEK